MLSTLLLFSCLSLTASTASQAGAPPRAGTWCAELASPGGPLRFELSLESSGSGWNATVRNGPETIEVAPVRVEGDLVVLSFPHYDSELRAHTDAGGERLSGTWKKLAAGGRTAELAFTARHAGGSSCLAPASQSAVAPFVGRFAVRFTESSEAGVLVLEAARGGITGTLLSTTGDWRTLAGTVEDGRMSISCFDGAHAFLLTAKAGADGMLAGDFHSGDRHHETWTARADPDAKLPDPFAAVRASEDFAPALRLFPDLEGRLRSLAEPELSGRARIIQVLGSWCPNCHDETALLAELDREHRAQGLSIVGLAFELTDDPARDAEQVRRMLARHHASYPVLLAGVADKARAAEALGVVDRVLAFPTTFFLHQDGRIDAVHSGFSGPATGPEHAALRAEFERRIEALLAEPAPSTTSAWDLLHSDEWNDEGQGIQLAIRRDAGHGTYVAHERLRFDRPTKREPVAQGDVVVEGSSVRIGDAWWYLDRRASVLLDPRDCGHRMRPAARSPFPVIDGKGVSDPAAIRLAVAAPDALLRREALHYLTVLAKQQDGEPGAEPEPQAAGPGFDPLPSLTDPDLEVRAMAAWACGELGLREAESALAASLSNGNAALRREAARALAKLGTEGARAALAKCANDLDPLVREAARAKPREPEHADEKR
jgi:thiol-disulfide isomerase/thioredoxin